MTLVFVQQLPGAGHGMVMVQADYASDALRHLDVYRFVNGLLAKRANGHNFDATIYLYLKQPTSPPRAYSSGSFAATPLEAKRRFVAEE